MTASKGKKGGATANARDASNAPIHSLLPMLVQYLTGLCCIHNQPEAVDIILGDYVYDEASETDRDVDVTVTVRNGTTNTAFMAYEVKREATPLDSKRVDSLCMKLLDMPELTHRAIVSTSGFWEPAIKKATKNGISLYQFKPWTQPLEQQFAAFGMTGGIEECFVTRQALLCWPSATWFFNTGPNSPDSTLTDTDPILTKGGKQHKKFSTLGHYKNELLLRSTGQLLATPKVRDVERAFHNELYARPPLQFYGPAWPHTHTMDTAADGAYLLVAGNLYPVHSATIDGHLQFQCGMPPMRYVIENVVTNEPLAGAIIMPEPRAGAMKALIFSPNSREIGIEFVQLEERHLNSIKELSLGNRGDRSSNKPSTQDSLNDK